MAHTHEFDCRVCGAHLDSQSELNQHVREKHSQQGASAGTSQRNQSNLGNQSSQSSQSGRSDQNRSRDDRNRR